jgi:ectoine hydroxylase-related dioxygenase (phytanoyl-CoA dioxygenase family)
MNFTTHKKEISEIGFTVINDIYSADERKNIISAIEQVDKTNPTFRSSADLFAIRQFLKEIPDCIPLIFNSTLNAVIKDLFGENYFAVKSIYFDKPEGSNWFVSYHQDLTISVNKKVDLPNFGPWTVKQNLFAVQPPLDFLKNIYTIRIHLDHTDEFNGALKIISESHLKDIYRPEHINWKVETEITCNVSEGGIMIMKPLLLHSSSKTTNNKKRRVIHIEFSNQELPDEIEWSERMNL